MKWYLPVGLYPDQMEALNDLNELLEFMGLATAGKFRHSLQAVLNYFRDPNNEAYLLTLQAAMPEKIEKSI